MFLFNRNKSTMPSAADALPGREKPIMQTETHRLGTPIGGLQGFQIANSPGLLLGRGEDLLAAARRVDRPWLRRRFHANPTYEESTRAGLAMPRRFVSS
jgi:hypothetical protein